MIQNQINNAVAPLAAKMRPESLQEFVGQQKAVGKNTPLFRLINSKNAQDSLGVSSLILYGPAGTGKTTLARLVAKQVNKNFVEISAVNATVSDVRTVIENAKSLLLLQGKQTVLFIDEVHRFSKAQQDVLLPSVEQRDITLIAATTENPSFSVITPLLSRSLTVSLESLTPKDIKTLIERALNSSKGLGELGVSIEADAIEQIIDFSGGDARRALTTLEVAAGAVANKKIKKSRIITKKVISDAISIAALKYDKDGNEHYSVISAFIKSVRGSDVDASLHYLARMLASGEDPRFIARRLVILASEDIGMADSNALQIAVAAAQTVALIGMPEARITLAHATVYLATAPKSNSVYTAVSQAIEDVEAGNFSKVPLHLMNPDNSYNKSIKAGKDYKYAHNFEHNIATQIYAPSPLENKQYYKPTQNGFEVTIKKRLEKIKQILKGFK